MAAGYGDARLGGVVMCARLRGLPEADAVALDGDRSAAAAARDPPRPRRRDAEPAAVARAVDRAVADRATMQPAWVQTAEKTLPPPPGLSHDLAVLIFPPPTGTPEVRVTPRQVCGDPGSPGGGRAALPSPPRPRLRTSRSRSPGGGACREDRPSPCVHGTPRVAAAVRWPVRIVARWAARTKQPGGGCRKPDFLYSRPGNPSTGGRTPWRPPPRCWSRSSR